MENVTIRPMQDSDLPLVEAFFDGLDDIARRFFDINGNNRRVTLRFFSHTDTDARVRFIAVENGKMIGYVYLRDVDTMIPWLGIAVSPEARGKHLGIRLIGTVRDWCREHHKGGILLTTHKENFAGQHLYASCGFECLGTFDANGEYLYLLRF